MINLPKLVIALFGVSAVLEIAEKIHNWRLDKNVANAQSRTRPLN